MAALGMRFRGELRSRWRSWLALAVVIGVAGGLVVAIAAGAHRTQTAYGRYLKATAAADAYVDPGFGFGDEGLDLRRVARLPQVVAAESTFHLSLIGRMRSGKPIFASGPGSVDFLVPSDGHRVERVDRTIVLSGRRADPARPDEATADSKSFRALGLRVGDRQTIRLIDHHALWETDAVAHLSADPRTAHTGPFVTVRLVGETANARSEDDSGQVMLTPAFYDAYGGRQLGAWISELEVRLRNGKADLPPFLAAVHRVAGKHTYGFFDPSAGRPKIQRSMDLQAQALRLVTAFGGAALLLFAGQALYRQTADESRAHRTLRALGMTRPQLIALGAARSAAVAVPAALITALVALVLSPLAPIGRARELEPDPGFAFDGSIVVAGTAAVLVAVMLSGTLASAWLARSRAGATGGGRESAASGGGTVASALRRAGCPPSLVTGVRMALARRTRAGAVPVVATLAAAVLAVAVAVTALTFASSLDHLLKTPVLYGQTWDFDTAPFGPPFPPSVLREVRHDRGLRGVAVASVSPVQIGTRTVGARAVDDVKGSVEPVVREGRAPRRPGEVLLARKTLDALDAKIGDTVTLHNGSRAVRLRIVGRGVLPATKWNKLGEGAQFSFRSLQRVQPDAVANVLEARLAGGAAGAAGQRHLIRLFDENNAVGPSEVGDFGGVRNMPVLIAAVFAAAAAATLAHTLLVSIRRRRRDLAILKTLGFVRVQVMATVAWQATTIAAIGVLVGLPLGVAVGRFGWNVFADDLGVVPEPVTPVGLTLIVVPAAFLVANAIASLPGWTAARTQPALALRTE